ncbi:MAG TPA: serine/threonine-protein kinase [Myxococcaceae bacterium]|jgi:serine/threonine-protein kinase
MGDDLTGRTLLGRYLVEERIAAGGMSVVYAGKDERLQRRVCVKVLVGIASSNEYQTLYEHFVQEAFALSQLQHPSTLRIYDFGYLDEEAKETQETKTRTPFFVLELITGGTLLQQVKRSGPLTPQAAVDVVEPIVQALAEAHARGIIHRDIKPSNILFAEVGEQRIPKLADFGIAKMRSGPGKAADTKGASGPPISLYSAGWAAPEQMRKKPVGPTADVYSLGLLLAFALTGKKVFPDDDNVVRTLANRIEGDEFVADSLGKMELPEPIRELIARACRVDPAERHQTAPDFLRAAREALKALVPPAPPPLPPARTPTGAGAVLRVSNVSEPQILAAGRRVALVPSSGTVDLGGEGSPVSTPARARFTFVPGPSQTLRLHVKGLNCFVAKEGGRPTSAVEVAKDSLLHLQTPQVPPLTLDSVRCQFARPGDPSAFQFPVGGGVTLAVPLEQAACAVLLDFGPGRELALVYSRPG